MTLLVAGLADRQEDKDEEAMGPSAKVAFDAGGKPTPVGEGFARGKGVEVSALKIKATPKGDYVFAAVHRVGRNATELLEEWLPLVPRKLNFPKSMRWAEGGPLRFARPIAWICALLGKQTLNFRLDALVSGKRTFGHRFLAPAAIDLAEAADYEKKMAAADVMLAFADRVSHIERGLKEACAPFGSLVEDPELVAITANLCETPEILLGNFEEKYLALPEEVIIKVLREHQFCFAARDRSGRLCGAFLAVTNGCRKNLEEIRLGNARVIRARLEDASFFFAEDKKVSMEARLKDLEAVVWQESLGTMRQKVDRLSRLAAWIAERLSPVDSRSAARAALLCKSDLVTLMVGEKEFAGLQGTMGGIYAAANGEEAAVSEAIADHYRPRFSGDSVPAGRPGQMVALADKMDDLAGTFGTGHVPTGSQDPYALRRKSAGIVAILKVQEQDLPLSELASKAIGSFESGSLKVSAGSLSPLLADFFRQRLESALNEAGFAADVVAATLSKRNDLVKESFARAATLAKFSKQNGFDQIAQAFSRVNNILAKPFDAVAVRQDLFKEEAEKRFYTSFNAVRLDVERCCEAGDFDAALAKMAGLGPDIDAYFKDVMVMAEDAAVRQNRLSFLLTVSGTLNRIADFTQLVKK